MRKGPRSRAGLAQAVILIASLGLAACAHHAAAPGATAAKDDGGPVVTGLLGSYLAGRHAQLEHDYGAAADFYGRALVADPANYELLNRTFLFDTTEGRMTEADALAQRIHDIDPAAVLPKLVLVVHKLKDRDYAGAAADGATLPQEGAERFLAPLMVAWAKAGAGDAAGAEASLTPLRNVQGFTPVVDFHSGLIADYSSMNGPAETAYQRVLAGSAPSNWRIIEALGGLYERTGRRDEAQALYTRYAAQNADRDLVGPALIRVASKTPPPPRIGSPADGGAEALFDLASLLNQPETVDLALIYGRLALDLKPDFAIGKLLVAEILDLQHRPEAALSLNQAIDRQSPYYWTARLRAAADLEALGRSDDAASLLKAMAAERPEAIEPLVELGDMLRQKNRFGDAVEIYDKAVGRPHGADVRDWVLYYSRAIALDRSGSWPRAEADLQHALTLQPDQPVVLNYLGYSWIEKGTRLDEALRMIERAAQLRPEDGYIVDSLGWALYRLGNYAQATKQLEHAVEMLPEDPTINDHLGDAYWQVGREGEARNQWRRALQFSPEDAEAKTIEAKLDRGLARPVPVGAAAQGG